jgi:hypothetical protein
VELTEGAIKAIQAPVREAEQLTKAVAFIDTPDPRSKLLVQSGKHELFSVPPPCRKHFVQSLEDLITYARTCQADPVIWHGGGAVTLILDDSDRRDLVVFTLSWSAPWNKLRQIEDQDAPVAFTQKELIRLLRFYLKANEVLITAFRRLSFQAIIGGAGDVGKSRESLGRTIEAEVQGAADLPEEIVVRVPIYTNTGEREEYPVRLLLEYDGQAQRILLLPEPGALDQLQEQHQADIHSRLSAALGEDDPQDNAKAVPIYFGKP